MMAKGIIFMSKIMTLTTQNMYVFSIKSRFNRQSVRVLPFL